MQSQAIQDRNMLICKITSHKHILHHNHGFIKYTMQQVNEIQFQQTPKHHAHATYFQDFLSHLLTILPHLEGTHITKKRKSRTYSHHHHNSKPALILLPRVHRNESLPLEHPSLEHQEQLAYSLFLQKQYQAKLSPFVLLYHKLLTLSSLDTLYHVIIPRKSILRLT